MEEKKMKKYEWETEKNYRLRSEAKVADEVPKKVEKKK